MNGAAILTHGSNRRATKSKCQSHSNPNHRATYRHFVSPQLRSIVLLQVILLQPRRIREQVQAGETVRVGMHQKTRRAGDELKQPEPAPSFGNEHSCFSRTMATTPVRARCEEATRPTHPSELAQGQYSRQSVISQLGFLRPPRFLAKRRSPRLYGKACIFCTGTPNNQGNRGKISVRGKRSFGGRVVSSVFQSRRFKSVLCRAWNVGCRASHAKPSHV